MTTYLPEGYDSSNECAHYIKGFTNLDDCIKTGRVLQARATICDSEHNLYVELGCIRGKIPREECAVGIAQGKTRDVAIIARVNRPVCFCIERVERDQNGTPLAILSRRAVQQRCLEEYIAHLSAGDVIKGKITRLETFGCFVDIGCGIAALLPIDAISVSRISHPRERFAVGQNIIAVVKGIDGEGKITLSHRELLGTWEENALHFASGQTVAGVIRSIESYGIFIELAPNLAGLSENKEGVSVGQQASVYIKSLIPEKMKIKLVLVEAFDADYPLAEYDYTMTKGHMDYWKYSPAGCEKVVESRFGVESFVGDVPKCEM